MNCHILIVKHNQVYPEQQIILRAFGYLTPSKLSQLDKIVFSFFGLSKDTPQMGKAY